MLFSKKSKGFFVEVNSHSVLVARTTAPEGPFLIEDIKSAPASGGDEALRQVLEQLQPKRGSGSYLHAVCGVYTPRRLVRRLTLDPKRFKEPGYLDETVVSQCRIKAEEYTLAALNAKDGMTFDIGQSSHKDIVVAGMAVDEINTTQKKLLDRGVYPERLEIGTLATLGALVDYLGFTKSPTPTLLLEIDADSTQSFIVSANGVETSRPIGQGLDAMVPIVQKELGLKDEESARKLFNSNTFDFTGMASVLTKKLLKELQSSIGFFEVQTGQSIGQVLCTLLPPKLGWLEGTLSHQLGVSLMQVDYGPWLESRGISFSPTISLSELDARSLGLFALMLSSHHAAAS